MLIEQRIDKNPSLHGAYFLALLHLHVGDGTGRGPEVRALCLGYWSNSEDVCSEGRGVRMGRSRGGGRGMGPDHVKVMVSAFTLLSVAVRELLGGHEQRRDVVQPTLSQHPPGCCLENRL